MAPISLWLSAASLALLPSTISFATAHDDYDYDHEPTSHEKHQLQRNAMDAALESSHLDTFASVQESRSYYYFHAGVEMAAASAATMTGHDAKELVGANEDAYLKNLENAIEAELARVRQQLDKANDDDDDVKIRNDTSPGKRVMDEIDESIRKKAEDPLLVTADQRLQLLHGGLHSHFQCSDLITSILSLPDVSSKLKELHAKFWKFAKVDNPNSVEYHEYNPHLYLDRIDGSNDNDNVGLFAKRDFKRGEKVYSKKTNTVYFQEAIAWINFLGSLQNFEDACVAINLTSMKRVSTPGRLVLEMVLDEVGIKRLLKANNTAAKRKEEEDESEDDDKEEEEEEAEEAKEDDNVKKEGVRKSNVFHFGGEYYQALRDIAKGEEII